MKRIILALGLLTVGASAGCESSYNLFIRHAKILSKTWEYNEYSRLDEAVTKNLAIEVIALCDGKNKRQKAHTKYAKDVIKIIKVYEGAR